MTPFCAFDQTGFRYGKRGISIMDALAEKLDMKLRTWDLETAAQVRERVSEVIEVTDEDVLDLMRSRAREQEVLDKLD